MPAPGYRYPWPASAITPQDMALLHMARESGRRRVPITALVAEAVRSAYGQQTPNTDHHPQERKETA
jgi:hypothetical protein